MSLLKYLILVLVGDKQKSYLASVKSFSDQELVKKVLDTKDSQLFGILYDRYGNKVFNKCFGFVKNTDEAKDLTQDIFLKVFLKLNTFDDTKAAFSTWLYTLTYNFCANYVTRDKKKQWKNDRFDEHEYHLVAEVEVDIEQINQFDADRLSKVLDKLSPEDKTILLLKYQDDATIKELQEIFGLSASAVKMRLNRAKSKVVKIYETL
jgi:RNA polymerase sigma-70 factor (ECF subfamily)